MLKRNFRRVMLFLVLFSLLFVSSAYAAAIKVKGLKEAKLYDLYSQVQSQILLNRFSEASTYSGSFNYDDIERNPDRHTDEKIYFEGEVLQVSEGSSSTTYRISSGKNYSDVFLVTYERPEDTERFLVDDTVCVYAEFVRLETYQSTANMSVTVPYCDADLIIRPVTDQNVASASESELNEALAAIQQGVSTAIAKDKGYGKVTKTNYEDFARHESLHKDEQITVTGKVLQVLESDYLNTIRLSVDAKSDMVFYLTVDPSLSTIRVLEDDTITVRGKYTGLYTYSSIRGGDITIPSASVETISVKGYKPQQKIPKDKEGNYKLTKKVFEDYARRPNDHLNDPIAFSAKILQVIEGDSISQYRMAVDNDSSYVMLVKISNSDRSMRVLEDDKVSVVAKFEGLMSYESTMGATITVPQCTATSIVIPGKASTAATKSASGSYKVTKKNYETFARDGDSYNGQPVSFTAKVVQAVDGDDITRFRLAVDKSYDSIFFATIENKDLNIRILEDDVITVDGISTGLYSYQSTMGGKITVPACTISKYTIDGYKQKSLGSPDSAGYLKVTKANYDEIARNPNAYKEKNISFRAKVVQVVERSGENIYRVAVDSDYDCMFYVEYSLPSGASRILENDTVTLKGEFYGIYTYSTTIGGLVSVPALIATDMRK